MDILSFLNSNAVRKIVSDQDVIKIEQQRSSFNLFTISSYNNYIENFHSDILASLLNPKAAHGEHHRFLYLFIDYLNKHHGFLIDKEQFKNVEITRETGRIDIWIKDLDSKMAIILENKINNAMDMDNQLDRYWTYSEIERKYNVAAIVYLTLDGTAKAPLAESSINHIIKNVAAFADQESDLLNGWMVPCLDKATNQDSSSFLYQYIKLIKHLAHRSMDTNSMKELYDFINKDGFETIDTIVTLYAGLTRHRADIFMTAINDSSPFPKLNKYKDHYCLFEFYWYKDNKLKLDVWFENNGQASIVFWNVDNGGINGRNILMEKLRAIDLLHEFSDEVTHNDNGYTKRFVIGDNYKTMEEIDIAVINFVKEFLYRLNTM